MKEQIKQFRTEIDGLAQLCEGLKPIEFSLDDYIMSYSDLIEYPNLKKEIRINSKEILKAVGSLKLSKAWLGKNTRTFR